MTKPAKVLLEKRMLGLKLYVLGKSTCSFSGTGMRGNIMSTRCRLISPKCDRNELHQCPLDGHFPPTQFCCNHLPSVISGTIFLSI